MEVNPNKYIESVTRSVTNRPQADKAKANGDQASFDQSQALEGALKQTPDSRTNLVQEARSLLANSSYPPASTVHRVAQLLAMSMR